MGSILGVFRSKITLSGDLGALWAVNTALFASFLGLPIKYMT
jgi:hypothetical protein